MIFDYGLEWIYVIKVLIKKLRDLCIKKIIESINYVLILKFNRGSSIVWGS